MTTATINSGPDSVGRPSHHPWLAVGAVLLGAFIASFDVRLFALGLPDLRGAFGLSFDEGAWLWAVAAIVIELGGSVLVIVGRWVWLGAGSLGVLTAVAMLVANNFWTQTGQDRFMATNAFFEHLGLIAGLVLITALSLREQQRGPSRPDQGKEAT